MQDQVLSEWITLGQPGDHPVHMDALTKSLDWLYRQSAGDPPCYVAVLDSPLGAHMAAELLAASACGRPPGSNWAEADLQRLERWEGYETLFHLRPIAPKLVERVLQRTEKSLASQGGGGDWRAVIPHLIERLGPARARPFFREGYRAREGGLGYGGNWTPLRRIFGDKVKALAGDKRLGKVLPHFAGLSASWCRRGGLDDTCPYYTLGPPGRRGLNQHDHDYLGVCGPREAPLAAAADFLVRSGEIGDAFVESWLDLLRLGFWDMLKLDHFAFVVRRPLTALRDARGRLHNAAGPAVTWADGTELYYLQGVRVPEQVVLCPDSLTPEQLLAEPNVETRRIWIEQMGGWARFVTSGQLLHSDTDGCGLPRRLFQLADPMGGKEPVRLVHIVCPSTHREYYLRVPPTRRTCAGAVAWTFGLHASDYRPSLET